MCSERKDGPEDQPVEMHQVRYFLAVVRSLNFTRAAEELRVAQPSLTRAIQKLESELQGPLFRRERSNTHLTELGRMMVPFLEAALAAAETAKGEARRLKLQDIGSLALGVCSEIDPDAPIAVLQEIAGKSLHLDVSVEVGAAATIERNLMAGQLDAAILAPLDHTNERFDVYPMREDAFVVVFAAGHRFAALKTVPLEALDSEPLITRSNCHFEKALAILLEKRGLRRLPRHRSNDPRWTAAFVRSGLASAVMPEGMALATGLPFRTLEGVPFQFRTVLATVAGRGHSMALSALIHSIEARHSSYGEPATTTKSNISARLG